MMLPSKELLSEVLNFEVSYVYVAPNGKFIEAQSENRDERVNIYELAHKCKEWAWKNDYSLHSEPVPDKWNCSTSNAGIIINEYFIADTEPEAIFKACEYILKQLSNK